MNIDRTNTCDEEPEDSNQAIEGDNLAEAQAEENRGKTEEIEREKQERSTR